MKVNNKVMVNIFQNIANICAQYFLAAPFNAHSIQYFKCNKKYYNKKNIKTCRLYILGLLKIVAITSYSG